jgi:hypothetical protein
MESRLRAAFLLPSPYPGILFLFFIPPVFSPIKAIADIYYIVSTVYGVFAAWVRVLRSTVPQERPGPTKCGLWDMKRKQLLLGAVNPYSIILLSNFLF